MGYSSLHSATRHQHFKAYFAANRATLKRCCARVRYDAAFGMERNTTKQRTATKQINCWHRTDSFTDGRHLRAFVCVSVPVPCPFGRCSSPCSGTAIRPKLKHFTCLRYGVNGKPIKCYFHPPLNYFGAAASIFYVRSPWPSRAWVLFYWGFLRRDFLTRRKQIYHATCQEALVG